MDRKRLGEMLLEAGIIDERQLDQALKVQRETGEKLGQILIRLGYITANTLLEFLGRQHGTQGIDPFKEVVDDEAVNSISEACARKYRAVPIRFKTEGKTKKLVVAMADPSDLEAIDVIRFMSDCTVEPVFVMEEHIDWFINYCYNKQLSPD